MADVISLSRGVGIIGLFFYYTHPRYCKMGPVEREGSENMLENWQRVVEITV